MSPNDIDANISNISSFKNYYSPRIIYNSRFLTLLLLGFVSLISGIGLFFVFNNNNSNKNNKTPRTVLIGKPISDVLGATNINRCFNKVVQLSDYKYYWQDGCRGYPGAQMCFTGPVELNNEELDGYIAWKNRGSKLEDLDPQCTGNQR